MSGTSNEKTRIPSPAAECTTLPCEAEECADVVPGLQARVLTGLQTILLVEDEAFVREVTVEVLKSAGYAVLTARNAAEAINFYDKFSAEVDLLLTDIVLPDENGRRLAWKLRSRKAELPTLLVTGYADQVQMTEAEAPGLECLPKPFSAWTLLYKVRMMLDNKRATPSGVCGQARLRI